VILGIAGCPAVGVRAQAVLFEGEGCEGEKQEYEPLHDLNFMEGGGLLGEGWILG
jgi:hypothetical protein